MSVPRVLFPAGILAGLLGLFAAAPAEAAFVRQFTPQGLVDRPVRATVAFSGPIVALGQADAPSPFDVDCGEVKGRSRWSDAKTWTYTLERPLQPGERCDFRRKPNLKAANGEAVSGEAGYAFFPPGPWPRSLTPGPGAAVEEDSAFLIDAGAALKGESVERNVWCEVDGVGHRMPVRVLADKTLQEMLAATGRRASPNALAVACAERLPPGAKMNLVWGQGVEAANGARSGRLLRFSYAVREPFRAAFSCEREKPNAPCSPLSDLRIEFSAPVDARKLALASLVLPDGKRSPAGQSGDGDRQNTANEIVFKRPFPQHAVLKIELPADLFELASPRDLERCRQRVSVEAPHELRRHPDEARLTWLAAFV